MRRLALSTLLMVVAACGGDGASDDDINSDAGGVDGAPGDAIGCTVVVAFEPTMPVAGATVVARGDIFGSSGVTTWTWAVRKRETGVAVPFTPLAANSRDIQFDVDTSGIYDVSLVAGGSGCQPFFGPLNVAQPGANTRAVRLRMVPPTSIAAPPQERMLVVLGGADFAAGTVTLDTGSIYPVAVRTPAPQNAAVPGYLRFTSRATPDAVIEAFADTSGNASVRLIPGRYDVLVVPSSSSLAPRVISDWDPLLQTLTIDGGTTLGGAVLDASGTGVGGARVSLVSGGVPSTVATTAADGTFSLRWREGATIEKVTITPAAGSDLPRLDAQVEIGAMTAITVRHAAVSTSDVGNTLVRVGGTPAASTDVLVDLSLAMAGTIRDGGGTNVLAQATGSHRTTLRTDASGRLPSARLVDGTGAVFITSAGPGARAALTLPLGGIIDAAAPVAVSGRILRSVGGVRVGARVRATLTGSLAHTGAPIPTTVTGADGRFTVSLAAGASYELVLSDPTADDASVTIDIASAATQDLNDQTLPAALSISGEIRASGTSVGARSVGVAALCHLACTGIDRSRPLGDAVTDALGHFIVAVPDPGVTQ